MLNDTMELDHVVQVHADGSVTDAPSTVYGPETAYDDAVEGDWTLLSGFTGQYGYNGPTMHTSEYIGGGLERHILSHPGCYVAIVSCDSSEDDPDAAIAGWCVAFKEVV